MMNSTRRSFIKQTFGSAAFFTLGRGFDLNRMVSWADQERIRGIGVEEGIVQLIWNENPLGPSPKAVEAISRGLFASNRYHDPDEIEKTVSKYHGIAEKYVTKGVGATEILYNVPLAFLEKDANMIMADPTYKTTGRVALNIGAKVKRIPLTKNYEHDLDAFAAAIDEKTRFIMICNPNNPTGTVTPASKIKRFLDSIPEKIVVMIDEAYHHFAEHPEYQSFDKYPVEGRNVIVVRTFSKLYGLAGLRIGYAIANEENTKQLRKYNLRGLTNLVAHYAAPAALNDHDFVQETKKVTRIGKEYFYREFDALGYEIPRSETNHIFVDVGIETTSIVSSLKEKNIFIRKGSDWDKPTCMRISIGTMTENEILMRELKKLL